MIRRFYVHNYRCLENFELSLDGQSSVLLIGDNGTGKTTVAFALEILQRIARGTNRVRDLIGPKEITRGHTDVPVRFEIEVALGAKLYGYTIAFDLPEGFKELRVLDERLTIDGQPIYTREVAQVHVPGTREKKDVTFNVDWHLVALPIITQEGKKDPASALKRWLSQMLILRPVPSIIEGESHDETLAPKPDLTDFAEWFSGLLAYSPSVYARIDEYLKQVVPDLKDIKNPAIGTDSRSLVVQFSTEQGSMQLPFAELSDGEKCFMICALVLAANESYGPLFCFWDEPDSYLALSEVGYFVMALRNGFQSGGQFVATSHNPEAIRRFSDDNTLVLFRRSHLEPTIIRPLSEFEIHGDLVDALSRGDVRP